MGRSVGRDHSTQQKKKKKSRHLKRLSPSNPTVQECLRKTIFYVVSECDFENDDPIAARLLADREKIVLRLASSLPPPCSNSGSAEPSFVMAPVARSPRANQDRE